MRISLGKTFNDFEDLKDISLVRACVKTLL